MLILGLGGFKGSGKDTVGAILRDNHGFRTFAFADPLKRAAQDIFFLTHEQVHGSLADKETVDPRWGLTPREILQRLGTEVGRSIHADTWTKNMQYQLEREVRVASWGPQNDLPWEPEPVAKGLVVTDVRFANEAEMVHTLGGHVVRVDRPDVAAGVGAQHASEALAFEADSVLANDGSLQDLETKVAALLASLQRVPRA